MITNIAKKVIFCVFLMFIVMVNAETCQCIQNAIRQVRCPGSGASGYFSGYGNCHSHESRLSGCYCYGCSSCND